MTTIALGQPRAASPVLWRFALAFTGLFAAFYVLTFVDARLLNGVSVWEKPSKFFLSLGVHMATLAWGLTQLPVHERQSAAIRRASFLFVAMALFELTYMVFRAARGEASHFNTGTPVAAIIYGLMGVAAVLLCVVTAYIGWRILRAGRTPMHLAAGAGFITSAILTVAVAGYMSGGAGHWVGGDQTDATGLPFFHWSTTGGDLRVPHFASLHIMQAAPLAAWFWPDKRVAAAALFAGIMVTLALLMQALWGIPLLRT